MQYVTILCAKKNFLKSILVHHLKRTDLTVQPVSMATFYQGCFGA